MKLREMNLDEVDKNFAVDSTIDKKGLRFYHFEDEPFRLYGRLERGEGGLLYRIPREVAEKTNSGVLRLSANTSGGRVRFRSDTKRVAIIARYNKIELRPHFALTGVAGLDLYSGNDFLGGFLPPPEMKNNAYESVITIPLEREMRTLAISLPLYAELIDLYIGIDEGARLEEAPPYKHETPVVYYGSSITQGACASRPSACYPAILSRMFDVDFHNLGFSGNARGEETIADYIASLDMSAFVCDYDYNASTPEHLKKTHYRLYKAYRDSNPDTPIIFMSSPNFEKDPVDRRKRENIIKKTIKLAKEQGDFNVYFVRGKDMFGKEDRENCTPDSTHPTDLGFYRMAKALNKVIAPLLK